MIVLGFIVFGIIAVLVGTFVMVKGVKSAPVVKASPVETKTETTKTNVDTSSTTS